MCVCACVCVCLWVARIGEVRDVESCADATVSIRRGCIRETRIRAITCVAERALRREAIEAARECEGMRSVRTNVECVIGSVGACESASACARGGDVPSPAPPWAARVSGRAASSPYGSLRIAIYIIYQRQTLSTRTATRQKNGYGTCCGDWPLNKVGYNGWPRHGH